MSASAWYVQVGKVCARVHVELPMGDSFDYVRVEPGYAANLPRASRKWAELEAARFGVRKVNWRGERSEAEKTR